LGSRDLDKFLQIFLSVKVNGFIFFRLIMPVTGNKGILSVISGGINQEFKGEVRKDKNGNIAVFELPPLHNITLSFL